MSEQKSGGEAPPESESLEQKKERLLPFFERSREIFQNPDRSLRDGALTVTQRLDTGEAKEISGLVAMEIDDQAIEFGVIEDDGEIGASGFMDWDTIVDATPTQI